MTSLKSKLHSEYLLPVLFGFGVFGLYYSRSVLSLYLLVLFVGGIWRAGSFKVLLEYRKNKALFFLSGIFLIYLLSGIHSEHTGMWLSRVKTNLPYLLLPMGFYGFSPLSKESFYRVLLVFIGVTGASAILVGLSYLLHFEQYSKLYLLGQTIPTPIMHVRYSYYLGLAAVFCLYLGIYSKAYRFSAKQPLLYLMLFLVLSVHVLAVRSGLLVLYSSFLALLVHFAIVSKNYKPLIISLSGLVFMGYLSYQLLPSVQNKVNYTLRDLKSIEKPVKNRHNYSDVVRVASIRSAVQIVREHPYFGVGIGDIELEMNKQYARMYADFPKEVRFNPISQYMFSLTAFGIIGFLFFYGFFFYPLWHSALRDPFLIAMYSGLALLFLAEPAIELQLGKVMTLSFICLRLIVPLQKKRPEHKNSGHSVA